MIELELPCCGASSRLAEDTLEARCDGCGIVTELAPDPEPVVRTLSPASALGIGSASALAA